MGVFDSIISKIVENLRSAEEEGNNSSRNSGEDTKYHSSAVDSDGHCDFPHYNSKLIESSLYVECSDPLKQVDIYCPYRKASIICGSIYIDKLGELTKFIITCLYNGETIDNIQALTQMGEKTINEEFDYLRKGKLISPNAIELTPLGKDYARLILLFQKLSLGIPVWYNSYLNKFEEDEPVLYETTNEGHLLKDNFSSILIRNDNYANSREIALDHLEQNIPFCVEVKQSIYTTIQIVDTIPKYRKLYLRRIDEGYINSSSSIQLSFPVDTIEITPKIHEINKYREALKQVESLYSEYPELWSTTGKRLLDLYSSEKEINKIHLIINAATGELCPKLSRYCYSEEDKAVALQARSEYSIKLRDPLSNDIDLEFVNIKRGFISLYYPFNKLEKDL